MQVTSIQIHPHADHPGQVRATADVVLNDSLFLRGIKIMRGRYGLFLAFPSTSAQGRHRAFETVSMRLRKEMQDCILEAYRECLSRPVSLFG
ncbi:MAG TPA: septation protein SpoVG family protein [Fibrobacteria bacterium]|nr:septation protein SpoVG family protein [Fibrobacteria bacterium]